MKQKASFSIDEETLLAIEEKLSQGKYRNRSHFVEFAIKTLLEDESE